MSADDASNAPCPRSWLTSARAASRLLRRLLARTARTRQRPAVDASSKGGFPWTSRSGRPRPSSRRDASRHSWPCWSSHPWSRSDCWPIMALRAAAVRPGARRIDRVQLPDRADLDGDPVTLKSSVLVDSPDNDEALFSPDGGRLLYTHHRGPSDVDIIVARADGSEPRVITPSPIGGTGLMQWAPDSRSIVLAIGGTTRVLRYDADRQADPTVLADDPDESLRIGERSIAQVQHVFRPPAGTRS